MLLAPFDLVVPEEPLAHEKLCPVLGLVTVPTARRGIDAARRELGNLGLIKEDTRAMWGWTLIEQFLQDVRYATRAMLKNPAFTALAALSLALGIGANAAIFQLLDAVRLRSMPVPNPQELLEVRVANGNGMGVNVGDNPQMTNPLWEELRDRQDAKAIADKFLESLQRPFDLDGHQVHISASIGIAIYPGDGETIDELLRQM